MYFTPMHIYGVLPVANLPQPEPKRLSIPTMHRTPPLILLLGRQVVGGPYSTPFPFTRSPPRPGMQTYNEAGEIPAPDVAKK